MFAILISLCAVLAYLVINISLVLLRNYKAQKFFQLYSPNVPVVPNGSIFYGHLWGVTYEMKNWKIINSLHEKYGKTFGYYICDQPWVSTKDLDLLKYIEMDKPHKHINRIEIGVPFKEFQDSIFQAEDDQWRRIRRAVAPALTNQKVKSVEVTTDIEQIISQLADGIEYRLERAKNETGKRSIDLDIGDMCHRYSLAVIFLLTYKRDRKINFKSEHDWWVDQLGRSARDITHPFIALSIMFPFLRPVARSLFDFHQMGKLRVKIVDYIVQATDINRVAREHHKKFQRKMSLETGKPERPFSDLIQATAFKRRLVDTIIDAYVESKIKYDEFIGSLVFLLLAGFETTASTITCLVWHLVKNPLIQEKLRDAIQTDGIESEYLAWCIQETIRWHPAVPLGVGRVLGEDVDINGLHLAKGTFVMPSTYSIHHDPEIWSDPEEFKPERWQKTNDHHPAAFMGFGLGPRNCVGGKLAVHEIKLVTRYLLTNFKLLPCPETPATYEFSSPGLVYTILDVPIKVKLVDLNETV